MNGDLSQLKPLKSGNTESAKSGGRANGRRNDESEKELSCGSMLRMLLPFSSFGYLTL